MTIEPGSPEWHARLATFLADPAPLQWWWLSFADPDKPEGQQFIGVALVEAPNEVAACVRAHQLGCNPGGAVASVPLPGVPRPEFRNRLFPTGEARDVAELSQEQLFQTNA